MEFINIIWDELINFNKNSSYKSRPIIIVQIDDNLDSRYNAIVVKYDSNKNVLVRYLDNPYYEEKYWWSGNKDYLPGLDPRCHHAKFLGDEYDDMEGLKRADFQENGYDDIINFEREPWRFFKSIPEYPYLNGVQGNINVNHYFIANFNADIERGNIPTCIRKYFEKTGIIRRIPGENIFIAIMTGLEADWKFEGERDFKNVLSHQMTNYFIRNFKLFDLSEDELRNIKAELKQGRNCPVKLIPYLIEYNIRIFDCNNNNLEIINYLGHPQNEKWINLLKYGNKYDDIFIQNI